MRPRVILHLALGAAISSAPLHVIAQQRRATPARTTTPDAGTTPAPADDGMLRRVLNVDDRFESQLESGCTYEVTVRGTVRPVRENANANATTQRLRPDLRVAATVRCPQSTESHIQERRVFSTGVTREELERLVELNATVHRMQNSGRCLYVPRITFVTTGFAASDIGYLCPQSTSRVRGGPVGAAR